MTRVGNIVRNDKWVAFNVGGSRGPQARLIPSLFQRLPRCYVYLLDCRSCRLFTFSCPQWRLAYAEAGIQARTASGLRCVA